MERKEMSVKAIVLRLFNDLIISLFLRYASTTPPEVGGIGARDKRAMALASGFLSTLCAGLHIANNGFRVHCVCYS